MAGTAVEADLDFDHDVVVVGGGPTGCSAAVFLARYGLETVVFDRGNAALPRAAHVANYTGFPAGVDVETLQALLHDHARRAGATLVDDLVESVERAGAETEDADEAGFHLLTVDGDERTARYVLAAAWYDGSYLRPLDADDEMFEMHEHYGERHERFAPSYPDRDGRTPLEGLYVAAPNGGRNEQAIVAAGQGAQVARSLLEDHRRAEGFPPELATEYDWLRPSSEFSGEWGERARWREWFETEAADHDLPPERFVELRERYIDRAWETQRTPEEVDALATAAHRTLAEHLDAEAMLAAIDDERIREYAAGLEGVEASGDD
jgi:choline dehydrogenase-like flavoprotein